MNRAEVSSCARAVSCRISDPRWWRTELELSRSKSFEDRHRSAPLGAKPKRVRFLGGGGSSFLFGMELGPVLRSKAASKAKQVLEDPRIAPCGESWTSSPQCIDVRVNNDRQSPVISQ